MTAATPRVFLRLRPASELELQKRKRRLIEVVDRSTVVADDGQEFSCHGVFDEGISSDSMYKESCATVPQHLLQGYNCTVLAYGVTGSGKSQTIRDVTKPIIKDVFDALSNDAAVLECTIRCSVVEIYLERIRDLLHEPSTVQLQPGGNLLGCAAVACVSAEDALNIIERGRVVQTASAFVPNSKSNRSTAVIQLTFQQTLRDGTVVRSRLHVIDLLACELVQVGSDSLEATQISISLKALHKQIRHFASGKPPIPLSDIPVVAQLLSYSFTSSYLSVFLTASPCLPGLQSLFKFGSDCKRLKMSLECQRQPPDRTTPWKVLARALAMECERSGVANDPKLKSLIKRIRNNELDSSFATSESGGQNHDRIAKEYERVKSERDQLCADLAILQARSMAQNDQNQQMTQEIGRLRTDLRASQFQRHQVEETLRISQFREAEAVVFLRQLRRFYFRLLQKTTSEGSPDNLTTELVDMDHLMMQSGLLEKHEVGGDVSIDCRPSKQSLQRSMAERERAVSKTKQPVETPHNGNHDGEIISLDDQPPRPVSVEERESPGKVEARQRLYKTPAGRYIAMKEKRLEEEVEQISEINSQLKSRLHEAMTNVEALSAKGGLAASLDKMRVAQEIRTLKEQLERKNNDLKAVIWKMNELHMVGKTLQAQAQSKEVHLSHLEQSLSDLRAKHSAAIEDWTRSESNLQQHVNHLKGQLQSLLVPVWQLSSDRKARSIPIQGRVCIPIAHELFQQCDAVSLGAEGEWAEMGVFPGNFSCVDSCTQTEATRVQSASSQTSESVYAIDRANTKSTEVQTDDVYIETNDTQLINESNVENLLFMMSPKTSTTRVSVSDALPSRALGKGVETIGSSVKFHGNQYLFNLPIQGNGDNPESATESPFADSDDETDFSSSIYQNYVSGNYDFRTQINMNEVAPSGKQVEQSPVAELDTDEASNRPSISFSAPNEPPNDSFVYSGVQEDADATDTPKAVFQASGISNGPTAATSPILIDANSTLKTNEAPSVHNAGPNKSDESSHEPKIPSSKKEYPVSSRQMHRKLDDADISLREIALYEDFPSCQEAKELRPTTGISEFSIHAQSSGSCFHERGALRATKSDISPVAMKKPPKTSRNLSSFLDRLQNQAKKRLEDDEKTETPEFMKLFKKIGGKNKHESVVEASGAVTSRDAQRTSFEQLKLGHRKVVDPRNHEAPSKSWKPKKKAPSSDSDSDDDSFAKSFMRGAQMAAPDSPSEPAQPRESNDRKSDSSESDDDNSFAKSFMRGAQMPPNGYEGKKGSIQEIEEDSSSSSRASDVNTETKSTEFLATATRDSSRSCSSSDDDVPKPTVVASKTTKTAVELQHTKSHDSDDSSSDDSSTSSKSSVPVVKQYSVQADVGGSTGGDKHGSSLASAVSQRSDSESSSSGDESSVLAQPVKPLPSRPASRLESEIRSTNNTTEAPTVKAFHRTDSSSSSDSSTEIEDTRPKAAAPPVSAKPTRRSLYDSSDDSSESSAPPKATHQPVKSKDSSSSSDDSSDTKHNESLTTQKAAVAGRSSSEPAYDTSTPEAIKTQVNDEKDQDFTKDASSEVDSTNSDSSSDRKRPGVNKIPFDRKVSVKESSSDESSSSHECARIVQTSQSAEAAPRNITVDGASSDESDSSDSDKKKSVTATPTKLKKREDSSSDESSSSDEDDDKKNSKVSVTKRNVTMSDDSESSGDSSVDAKQKKIADLTNIQDKAPKTEVPDFAARLRQAAEKSKGKKKKAAGPKSDFVIKDGKVVRRSSVAGGEKKKIKVKIKKAAPKSPGDQTSESSCNESSPRRRPRRKSLVKDKKFEIKDGKLVRKKQGKPGATKKSASFKIVDGKLVKKEDESVSSGDSDCTEKA